MQLIIIITHHSSSGCSGSLYIARPNTLLSILRPTPSHKTRQTDRLYKTHPLRDINDPSPTKGRRFDFLSRIDTESLPYTSQTIIIHPVARTSHHQPPRFHRAQFTATFYPPTHLHTYIHHLPSPLAVSCCDFTCRALRGCSFDIFESLLYNRHTEESLLCLLKEVASSIANEVTIAILRSYQHPPGDLGD